jgi:hypothetical protein
MAPAALAAGWHGSVAYRTTAKTHKVDGLIGGNQRFEIEQTITHSMKINVLNGIARASENFVNEKTIKVITRSFCAVLEHSTILVQSVQKDNVPLPFSVTFLNGNYIIKVESLIKKAIMEETNRRRWVEWTCDFPKPPFPPSPPKTRIEDTLTVDMVKNIVKPISNKNVLSGKKNGAIHVWLSDNALRDWPNTTKWDLSR